MEDKEFNGFKAKVDMVWRRGDVFYSLSRKNEFVMLEQKGDELLGLYRKRSEKKIIYKDFCIKISELLKLYTMVINQKSVSKKDVDNSDDFKGDNNSKAGMRALLPLIDKAIFSSSKGDLGLFKQ